jgi:hypothetical protein
MSAVKAYVSGVDFGPKGKLKYSNDLGATWAYTSYFPQYDEVISGLMVSPDDSNTVICTTPYGPTGFSPGIVISYDGGKTPFAVAPGNWASTVPIGSNIGDYNTTLFTKDGLNAYTAANKFPTVAYILRRITSNPAGGFNTTITSAAIYGSGNPEIYALAGDGAKVYAAVGRGTALNPTRVFKSINNATSFTLLGTPGASNIVGALHYVLATDTLYAVTLDGVYRSVASAAFTLIYSFPDAHFVVTSIKNIGYAEGTLYVNSRTKLYATADDFATTPTTVYDFGGPNLSGIDFYLSGKGFAVGNGTDIFYTADNGSNINNTNTDPIFFPMFPAVSAIVGCGCEPGFSWDEISEQCITNTPMCPEGLVYNPVTGNCEGTSLAGCDTDVAIVIDVSGSITQEEMPEYKNMLRGIVDGLEMGYDINGNLNTLANSLGRITSGEIRVGIVFFNAGSYAIVGGVTLNYGPTAWEAGGANNSPAGTVANPGLLKNAINTMGASLPGTPGSMPDQYGVVRTQGVGYTNSFAGLGRGYDVVWGTNSRPAANKKILFVTDGWPNYIDPNALLTNYGVTLPAIITSFGTTPANQVCGFYGVNDITSIIQTTYQNRRLADYIATMDLAQEIKAGTAVPNVGSGGSTEITLLITGQTIEQNITKGAFVGIDPTDSVTPCYLDNSSIFGNVLKDGGDNISQTAGEINIGACPSWNGSYTTSDKFPSNTVSGLPDYYQTDLIPSAYAGIGLSISASIVCAISQSALTCTNPCQIIQDPTTSVYYCNCVSSIPFNTCCYDLINCADNTVYASVNTTGQDNDFMAQFIDQYIFIEGVEVCMYVSLNPGCTSSTTLDITVDQITAYADCIDCNQDNEVIPYYNLIKCGETTPLLQTTTDLSSYLTGGINQSLPILTFVEYPDICFTVEETFTFLPQVVVTVDVAYNDCPTCLSYLC